MTATQWLEVLASYSLQVLIVIGVCCLLDRAVARTADRCSLWNTCFFSILLLGLAALLLPRLHLIQPWSRLEPQTLLAVSVAQATIGRLLLAIWCIGATVSLVRWIAHAQQLRRALGRCDRLPELDVRQLLGETNTNATGGTLPTVLISDEFDGPFCWQLHEPTVVLPRFLLEGNRDDLHHVLVHELEHLKTNHPLQLFFQHLAHVVCWFHPAVWNAGAWASLMREFTCDEAAASQGANSAAYLRTLLHIAEHCEQKRNLSAIGFGRTQSEIVLRARRLVELANNATSTARGGRIGIKMAMCILLIVVGTMCLVTIPSDPLSSSRSAWSPWPRWTANSLHCFGYNVRDYEQYDRRVQVFEILHDGASRPVTAHEAPAEEVTPQ